MEIFHINAVVAAIVYSLAALISKEALARGAGILRLSLVVNLVFIPVFACLLTGKMSEIPWAQIHYPVLTGLLFFLGQLFTFCAIKVGDVSLQTPVMGTKAVFAVLIAIACGTEMISVSMAFAALISMLGVALLGFSGDGVEKVGVTLCLALLSSFFFAGSDTMVGLYAVGFGIPFFLFITIIVNALCSLALIPFFSEPFTKIPRRAWPWVLGASLLMGLQALLLNYTLARYQNVAVFNVLYSTRGLWSVLLGALAVGAFHQSALPKGRGIFLFRLGGALLMCVSVLILFIP